MNITISHLVIYPLFSKAAFLENIPCVLLYSCTFLYKKCASFSPCCVFCGLATCTASLSFFFFLLTSIFGHSHLKCITFQHLKHLTSSTVLFLLILTSSFIPYLITLLNNTSNLFLGIGFPFSSSFLFLQLWTRYPNFSQLQHFLPSLSSNSALSLVRAYL